MRLTDDLLQAADADLVGPNVTTALLLRFMHRMQIFIAVRSNEFTQVPIPNFPKQSRKISVSNALTQVLSALHGHIKPTCMVVSVVSGQVMCHVHDV